MRFAIAAIASRGGRQKAGDVCTFVRECKAGEFCWYLLIRAAANKRTDFEVMIPHFKELRKKQYVTSESLKKIEDGSYRTDCIRRTILT